MNRRRTLLLALGIAALVAVGLAALRPADSPAAASPVTYDRGSGRLDFALPGLVGGPDEVTTASLAGRPAVLNFFASWCAPCVTELPALEQAHRELGDRVAFVAVNPQSSDSDTAATALLRETGVSFPAVRDAGDDLLRAVNPGGALPTTVLLDGSGRVVDVHLGAVDAASLRAKLAPLLR